MYDGNHHSRLSLWEDNLISVSFCSQYFSWRSVGIFHVTKWIPTKPNMSEKIEGIMAKAGKELSKSKIERTSGKKKKICPASIVTYFLYDDCNVWDSTMFKGSQLSCTKIWKALSWLRSPLRRIFKGCTPTRLLAPSPCRPIGTTNSAHCIPNRPTSKSTQCHIRFNFLFIKT